MRILLVAMPCCVNMAHWVRLIADEGWDVHLFTTLDSKPHPSLRAVTLHTTVDFASGVPEGVRVKRAVGVKATLAPAIRLAEVIRETQPNIIHSLELRPSAELVLETHRHLRGSVPIWAATDWADQDPETGAFSDEQFRSLFSLCDYFASPGSRSSTFPSRYGFRGKTLSGFTRPSRGVHDIPDQDSVRRAVEFYKSVLTDGRCTYTAGSRGPELASPWDRLAEAEQWLRIREAQLDEERLVVETLRTESGTLANEIWVRDTRLAEQQAQIEALLRTNEELVDKLARSIGPPVRTGTAKRMIRFARTGPYRAVRLAWRGLRVLREQGVNEFGSRAIAKCGRLAARVQSRCPELGTVKNSY